MLTLSNALSKNALTNGLLAKKMPNVFLLFKGVKRSVEVERPVGKCV